MEERTAPYFLIHSWKKITKDIVEEIGIVVKDPDSAIEALAIRYDLLDLEKLLEACELTRISQDDFYDLQRILIKYLIRIVEIKKEIRKLQANLNEINNELAEMRPIYVNKNKKFLKILETPSEIDYSYASKALKNLGSVVKKIEPLLNKGDKTQTTIEELSKEKEKYEEFYSCIMGWVEEVIKIKDELNKIEQIETQFSDDTINAYKILTEMIDYLVKRPKLIEKLGIEKTIEKKQKRNREPRYVPVKRIERENIEEMVSCVLNYKKSKNFRKFLHCFKIYNEYFPDAQSWANALDPLIENPNLIPKLEEYLMKEKEINKKKEELEDALWQKRKYIIDLKNKELKSPNWQYGSIINKRVEI